MTQSHRKVNAAISGERKLVKGAGYVTIFLSDKNKFELSSEGKFMRQTTMRNGGRKEFLYTKVESPEEICAIEYWSERWIPYGINSKYHYIVMEQRTAANKLTGKYKIIEKTKALIDGWRDTIRAKNNDDWLYYKRRTDKS